MKPKVLAWLACPICRGELELEGADEAGEISAGSLRCQNGHSFPVVRGVPRLLPGFQLASTEAARSIHESFSREWSHFDYQADRTWGQTVEERRADFLRHIDRPRESLAGKVVLDAGCGNGSLSVAISSFGCDVLATDISSSVEAAYRQFKDQQPDRTSFVQSDLMNPPFKPESFDVVYCAGVLHHTPDTRATFDSLLPALAPGGTIFVWLYWREPGLRARLSEAVRRVLAPLPAPLKHAAVWSLVPQSLIRNRIKAARGRAERLNAREVAVRMLDSYTPRYRWVHTPDELRGWYEQHGLTNITLTEEGPHGFGVAARRLPIASA
jgi:2-polyprenyl-3-methyl-5-hydroxy-6-metoxy-1,4-benzoquinol methylase